LSGIAARFAVRGGWPALYAANRHVIGPDPDVIRPGAVLVLPGQRAPVRYRVVPGDTLAAIAAALAVRGGWPALYAANRHVIGPDPDVIHPGVVLTVPRPAAPSPAAPGPAGRPVPPPSAPPGIGHRSLPGRTGAPAAAGMPQWLKTLLLAVGLVILAVFLAGPVLAVHRRRQQAAGRAVQLGNRLRAVPASAPAPAASSVPAPAVSVPAPALSSAPAPAPSGPAEAERQPDPPGVPEAVLLSLDAVRAGDPAGVCGLLEVIAVLSPAEIRRELLYAAGQAGVLAGGRRVAMTVVDQAVDRLADWSLVNVSLDGQVVTAHRQVAGAVQDELARRGRLAAACRAVALVLESRARALAGSPDRRAVQDIPRQVAALNHVAGSASETDEHLAAILLRLRFLAMYFLIELGDSGQAIAVGEPLVAELERSRGAGHPDTLNARNSLAAAYQAAGRPAEAVPLFEQTLVGWQRLLGPDHPDTLTSQNNLACAYQDVGRFAEAILLFKLTLAARERLLGPDHPSTLTSQNNLACAYQDVGRFAEAIPLLEQTLAGRERVLGADHPDTLASRNNLEGAYQDAVSPAEAIPAAGQSPAGHTGTATASGTAVGSGQPPDAGRPGASRTRVVLADYGRLVVTHSTSDDTVYVLRPPGEDPKAILRVARLVLPEDPYRELAGQLGLPAIWPIVLADYARLVVTCSKRDGAVFVLRPPGEDPRAILRVARLVLPEDSYGELAEQLGVPAGRLADGNKGA
jgi:tetratricopeptide (TPR) repeat protein/LysM repeat protein